MSQALLEELTRQGIMVTVKGDKLALSAPKGVITPEVVARVGEHKAELMLLLQGYHLRYSGPKASDAELAEIAATVGRQGYTLLWSTVLRDLVAFVLDDTAKSKIPAGFVPYTLAELEALFANGRQASTLRRVHEVKKLGGRVVPREGGVGNALP